jgi:hypothetical protein
MTISNRITDELINAAVATDDLTDALFAFQQAIGVDDGGVAAVAFSAGQDAEWPSAPEARRREIMEHYITLECLYAPSPDESEMDEAGYSPKF